jgi:large subunit ribosomal protein L1
MTAIGYFNMAKHGKKYREGAQKAGGKARSPRDAIELAKEISYAKFDEAVEVHLLTSADPRHSDQQIREVAPLPHGTGKPVRVMVFADGEAASEAQKAGTDYVADPEIISRIEGGWSDFDISIATPDQMRKIGRLGRYLGRKGLMPNPRTGTVVQVGDLAQAIHNAKMGRAEIRMDRTAIIHTRIGAISFEVDQLLENLKSVISTIVRATPSGIKGQFLKTATLATTMGPGIKLDIGGLQALASEE